MIFYLKNRNNTVKQLRKESGLTAKDLAHMLKCNTTDIIKIDGLKLKNINKEMKDKLIPVFRGDRYDNVPW